MKYLINNNCLTDRWMAVAGYLIKSNLLTGRGRRFSLPVMLNTDRQNAVFEVVQISYQPQLTVQFDEEY